MKLKTHSGAKKRVKISAKGKFITDKTAKRHLLSNKSKKAKGRGKYGLVMSDANKKAVQRSLPYGR